jgi:hypothetical protein
MSVRYKKPISRSLRDSYEEDFRLMLNHWYENRTSTGKLLVYLVSYEWVPQWKEEDDGDFQLHGYWARLNARNYYRAEVQQFSSEYSALIGYTPPLTPREIAFHYHDEATPALFRGGLKKITRKKDLRVLDHVLNIALATELLLGGSVVT